MLGKRALGTNALASQTVRDEDAVFLAAQIAAAAAVAGTMTLGLSFAATSEARSQFLPFFSVIKSIEGTIPAQSALTVDLGVVQLFGASFAALSDLTPHLTKELGYSASTAAVSGQISELTRIRGFDTGIDAYSSMTATMAVLVEMATTIASVSTVEDMDWTRVRDLAFVSASNSAITIPEFVFLVGFETTIEAFSNVVASLNFLHRVLCGQIDIAPLYSAKTTMAAELYGNTEFTNQLTGKVSFERC